MVCLGGCMGRWAAVGSGRECGEETVEAVRRDAGPAHGSAGPYGDGVASLLLGQYPGVCLTQEGSPRAHSSYKGSESPLVTDVPRTMGRAA